jgi:crossover junction endodeoxyribonuclease RusA
VEFFEFIVEGPAISLRAKKNNARRYQKWIRTIRSAAQKEWPINRQPTNCPSITVNITNYYTVAPPDVDNVIKPILDALETVVYVDDQQVHKVISEKFDLTNVSSLDNPSALLAAGLEKYTEVLHIVVMWTLEE